MEKCNSGNCRLVGPEELIPRIVISNEGMNVALIAYPIVCSIAIGIVIKNEGLQTFDCTQEGIIFHKGETKLASVGVFDDGHCVEFGKT